MMNSIWVDRVPVAPALVDATAGDVEALIRLGYRWSLRRSPVAARQDDQTAAVLRRAADRLVPSSRHGRPACRRGGRNEDRDTWLNGLADRGVVWETVLARLENHPRVERGEWRPLHTAVAVIRAVQRHRERNRLPLLPRRPRGRKPAPAR